jgi:hypothetical protein
VYINFWRHIVRAIDEVLNNRTQSINTIRVIQVSHVSSCKSHVMCNNARRNFIRDVLLHDLSLYADDINRIHRGPELAHARYSEREGIIK